MEVANYQIGRIKIQLKKETGMDFELIEQKRIPVPRFMGTGGSFHFVKFENEENNVWITGQLFNGYFIQSSVSNIMYAGNCAPYWYPETDRQDIKHISETIKEKIIK